MKTNFDEDRFLTPCALRFDFDKYLEKSSARNSWNYEDFVLFSRKILATREFFAEQLDNFAAFCSLQRYLYKWGGERLTVYSEEHTTFRLLFLHLYREDVPPELRYQSYHQTWQEKYAPIREQLAAQIRRNLRRVGRGAKIQL